MVTPYDVVYMEFEALFGEAYARRLDEAGKLSDGVVDSDALYWSSVKDRAVVFLPGVTHPVVVDNLEEIEFDAQTQAYRVRYLGAAYDIPEEMAWSLDRLYELRAEGFEQMPWALARDPNLAAFIETRNAYGVYAALRAAVKRQSAMCSGDYASFWWNKDTSELEVDLPDLSALVPLNDLGAVEFDEAAGTMFVHYLPTDEWVKVPAETHIGLDYLLTLRDAEEEWNRGIRGTVAAGKASPADGAIAPQPLPRSPGRASWPSPIAAISSKDYNDTASAAAGASSMHTDAPMVDSEALNGEKDSPTKHHTNDEPMDDFDVSDPSDFDLEADAVERT